MRYFLLLTTLLLISLGVKASDVIIFDEGATPEKVLDYRLSANTPDYQGRTDVLINPVIVSTHSFKYWKHESGQVVSMTQAERDAQDAAEASAATSAYRLFAVEESSNTSGDGIRLRALVELFNKRDNYIINRIVELQTTFDVIKAGSGSNANTIRSDIPNSWLATQTRTKANALNDYRDDINAGNQDNP